MKALMQFALATLMIAANGLAVAAPSSLGQPDGVIVDRVRLKLARDPVVKGVPIEVKAENSVVTLIGCVASANVSRRAAQIARNTQGVKMVKNSLASGRC